MSFVHPLDSIVFIESERVPESFIRSLGNCKLEKSIPLPARRPDNSSGVFEIEDEALLAGILLIFAYDTKNKNAPYYKKILRAARPNIIIELSRMAFVKAKDGDFELADEIARALLNLAPDDASAALAAALVYDMRGEWFAKAGLDEDADACDEEALRLFERAMNADMPDAYFNAAVFFLRKENFSRAKDCFEAFLALASRTVGAFEGANEDGGNGGSSSDENSHKKIERALECLNMIAARNLDDDLFKSARALIVSGQEEKGIALVREFLRKNGGVWNAWFLLGWGLRLLGRYEDAREAFLQAAQCEGGKTSDTYNELAICCMEMNRLGESEAALKTALSLAPEDAKIMANMGVLLCKAHKAGEAQQWFRAALEYNPDDPVAKQALGRGLN